jgi:putative membrane protein
MNWNQIYCGAAPPPEDIWQRWNFDPALLLALVLLSVLIGRNSVNFRPGAAAIVVLAIAFISPLCALSSALFSARVVHHVLLVAVAAPLLALAFPQRRAGLLAFPFAISALVLWGWHVPFAYDLALSHVGVYWIMQLSLLGSAIWFWRAVLGSGRSPVEALVLVVAGFAQMGMLGAILTFAPAQLYAAHETAPMLWGLLPLADQQLGGLIMWVPAGVPYAIIAVVMARRLWAGLAANDVAGSKAGTA